MLFGAISFKVNCDSYLQRLTMQMRKPEVLEAGFSNCFKDNKELTHLENVRLPE